MERGVPATRELRCTAKELRPEGSLSSMDVPWADSQPADGFQRRGLQYVLTLRALGAAEFVR
jgi:hypothetical protein